MGRLATLLRFKHKAAALVEIDETGTGQAAGVAERHRPLEDVVILAVVGNGRSGTGNIQIIAEFGKKKLVIGSLRGG